MKNPSGLCMCGCGRPTPSSPVSRRGYKRGEPLMYIKGHSSRKTGPDYVIEDRGHVDWEDASPRYEYVGKPSPCWIWQKSVSSEDYGRIWNGKGHDHAHRVYYERFVGTIAKDHEIHHECGVRLCVNPAHLVEVTRAEHMAADGRSDSLRQPPAPGVQRERSLKGWAKRRKYEWSAFYACCIDCGTTERKYATRGRCSRCAARARRAVAA